MKEIQGNQQKPASPGENIHSRDSAAKEGTRHSRRLLLRRLVYGASASLLAGGTYVHAIEPTWVETVRRPMPVPDLHRDLHGFRIIQLSDFHFGTVSVNYLNQTIRHVNELAPDLVVLTGDLVHHGKSDWIKAAAIALAGLRARKGVVAVLGNHDWLAMSPSSGTKWWAERVAAAMTEQGVRILRNQVCPITQGAATFYLVGLEEYWSPDFNPRAAFAELPPDVPGIALVHNPDAFLEIIDRPVAWTLSGHTHGGQVNLPFLGPLVLPVKNKDFVAGTYTRAGKHLYINRGLGWAYRLRFNARPEITEFTLTQA